MVITARHEIKTIYEQKIIRYRVIVRTFIVFLSFCQFLEIKFQILEIETIKLWTFVRLRVHFRENDNSSFTLKCGTFEESK